MKVKNGLIFLVGGVIGIIYSIIVITMEPLDNKFNKALNLNSILLIIGHIFLFSIFFYISVKLYNHINDKNYERRKKWIYFVLSEIILLIPLVILLVITSLSLVLSLSH